MRLHRALDVTNVFRLVRFDANDAVDVVGLAPVDELLRPLDRLDAYYGWVLAASDTCQGSLRACIGTCPLMLWPVSLTFWARFVPR